MRLISWNVNGLRACIGKGFMDFFTSVNADIFSIQETKLQEGQIELELKEYNTYWDYAVKKGYSGTAVLSKHNVNYVNYGMNKEEHDKEGRIITLEFEKFYLVNVYTPNSQRGLTRLDYRMAWDDAFREYVLKFDENKPVILCGDLNVAHQEIDLKNPKTNANSAGFTMEEINKLSELLEAGFVDSFRHLYPKKTEAYTWWSYMRKARENNAGWRIDYFLVSDRIKDRIREFIIHNQVMGSDHCPIELNIDI